MGEPQYSNEKSEEQYAVVAEMVDLKGRPVDMATTGRWRAASFLIVYEVCERMSFFGISANLVVYLTNELHEGTVQSARNVSNWGGAIWMTPILGAYIADTYLGRFWTFTAFCSIYLIGMVLITLAVSLPSLRPPPCGQAMTTCRRASTGQVGFFYFALYLLCLGTGGTKPNISTMGADQFDERDPKEARLKHSFFNWWMFGICIGVIGAQTVLVYIQDNVSWGLGYGIPTVLLLVSICIFIVGTPFYRHKKPAGSPLSEIAQVFTAAMLNRRVKLPGTETALYELDPVMYSRMGKIPLKHTDRYRWLDKAAVIRQPPVIMQPTEISRWRLCTVSQVEETKMVVGMMSVWLTMVVFDSVMSNAITFFIKQGQTLDRRLGGSGFQLPPASLGCILSVSMIILVPMYDRFLVPLFRSFTGLERGLTLLQRAGIGVLMQAPVLAVAALVERRRLGMAAQQGLLDSPHATIPMSILWLLPQYALVGLADTFTSIAILEFFYDQAPLGMKSIGTAIYTTNYGMGYFLSSLIITGVSNATNSGSGRTHGWLVNNLNRCRIDYYYWFLAILAALNAVLFVFVARSYQYADHYTYTPNRENRKTETGDNSTS